MIFCTLSVAGSHVVRNMPPVRYLIVDEAAQATEPESLIPLSLLPRGMLLAGDPNQLSCMCTSAAARRAGLERSLMQRLMDAGHARLFFLETQYRMHPAISAFPNERFYCGRLRNAPSTESAARVAPWAASEPWLGPCSFVNVVAGVQTREGGSGSLANPAECDAVVAICKRLRDVWGVPVHDSSHLRVLTFYAAQARSLRRQLASHGMAGVSVGTVDGSQGAEAETIVLSFVRAPTRPSAATARGGEDGGGGGGKGGGERGDHSNGGGGHGGEGGQSIGFVADWRRLNVAITRARRALVMVGHAETLLASRKRRSQDGDSDLLADAASDLVRAARAARCVYRGVGGEAEPLILHGAEEDGAEADGAAKKEKEKAEVEGRERQRRRIEKATTGVRAGSLQRGDGTTPALAAPANDASGGGKEGGGGSMVKSEEDAEMQARIHEMQVYVQARKEEEAERARQKLLRARAAMVAFAPPGAYELKEEE